MHALGTFCILGTKPRNFSEEDRILFLQLKGIVEKLLRSLDRTHSTKKIEKLRRIILHNEQHDHLTGLANRSRFSTTLNEAIVQMRNGERNSAVMLVDLDGFKQVNDTYGHNVGDECIRSLVKTVTGAVRATEERFAAYGIGGDELPDPVFKVLDGLLDKVQSLSMRVEELEGELDDKRPRRVMIASEEIEIEVKSDK